MVDRSGGAPRGTLLEVVHELKDELEELRVRLDLLEAPRRVRVRELEVVDDEDRPVVRLVVREDGTAGLECVRAGADSLVTFVGVVDGKGALQLTGGRHGNVVLDVGADQRGGHFVFLDPEERTGAKVLAWMGRGGAERSSEPVRP